MRISNLVKIFGTEIVVKNSPHFKFRSVILFTCDHRKQKHRTEKHSPKKEGEFRRAIHLQHTEKYTNPHKQNTTSRPQTSLDFTHSADTGDFLRPLLLVTLPVRPNLGEF